MVMLSILNITRSLKSEFTFYWRHGYLKEILQL